ncbi:hypothetical protein [Actinoallomurus iriomotensis]|uniref:Excalibur calcium-binding domain-containing protein n=1 Tax=Actinoallomurus iriomotensis TaxID=478107 RepID=A0A9W6RX86_9ACTN|nr:hypothetical protein [Actinoallomurus iriomotensis]GLY83446.1 hypothetical protein Airi02_013760 [Actinoallomurus iriomotensis]
MHKRNLTLALAGATLFGSVALTPGVTPHANAAQSAGAATATASHNAKKPVPPATEEDYHRGYRSGRSDARSGCYNRDVTGEPADYQSGWGDGFADGGC